MIRTRQPQGVPRIDWSNPITRGLIFAAVAPGYDAALGLRVATALIKAGPSGLEFNGSYGTYFPAADVSSRTLIAEHVYTSNCADWQGVNYQHYVSTPDNSTFGIGLAGNADRIYFSHKHDNDNNTLSDFITFPYRRVWGMSGISGSTATVYRDGLSYATAAYSGTAFAQDSRTRFTVGSTTSTGKSFPWAYYWERILSADEHLSVAVNPWALLAPTRSVWVQLGAASGTGETTERTVAARAKARGAATTTAIHAAAAAGRVRARAADTVAPIRTETAAGRLKARGTDTRASIHAATAAGRVKAKAANTVEHIDAGAVSRAVAGKVRARGAAATLAIRNTSVVGRVKARAADTVTSTRLSLASGRVKARAGIAAAPVVAGMITTTVAGRLRARGNATATATRVEAVAGRVKARGTDTANSIRAATAAARLRAMGSAAAGPYVAPTLPAEVPESSRTLAAQAARLGASPVSAESPRLGATTVRKTPPRLG